MEKSLLTLPVVRKINLFRYVEVYYSYEQHVKSNRILLNKIATALFFFMFFVCGSFAQTQIIEVISVKPVETTTGGGFFHPVFSPSADYLLCTQMNFKGLKQVSLADGKISTLTEATGAGYRPVISDDGLSVAHRDVQLMKNRKFTALRMITLSDRKSKELIAPTRETFTPAFSDSELFFVKATKLNRKSVPVAKLKPIVQIEDRKMVVYAGNIRSIICPNGETESYIWPSFSPDGKMLVYTVAGKGTFISSADGKNVQSLGKLSAPKWLNNRIIIGMDDKYFGQELISSELIAVSIDGKNRQILAGDKAIYPAASFDGRKIAYSNNDGQLFIMNINIK